MSDGDGSPPREEDPDARGAREQAAGDPDTGDARGSGTGGEGTISSRRDGAPPGTAGSGEARPGGGDGSDGGPGRDAGGLDPEAIDVEALTGPRRSLDPRVRLVWVLRAGLGALVLGGLAGAVGVLTAVPTWVGPVVFTLAFGLGVALAVARYRSWSYRVREDSLFLDRGVVTRVRTVVPYVRIQHVDSSRGPVERLFGLATVVVYTAGSRGADVSIPGLPPDRAEELQERLKRLAIAAEGEDAV